MPSHSPSCPRSTSDNKALDVLRGVRESAETPVKQQTKLFRKRANKRNVIQISMPEKNKIAWRYSVGTNFLEHSA